mgnify:CR=1 FL=1
MLTYFKGSSECRRCVKTFERVYYEMPRSHISSGRFQEERIPSKPRASNVHQIGRNQIEHPVVCPRCGLKKLLYLCGG